MQVVDENFLDLGISNNKISKKQLILLGLDENNYNNFRELSIGKKLSDARAELFVLLKDIEDEVAQENVIQNYKLLQKLRQSTFFENTPEIVDEKSKNSKENDATSLTQEQEKIVIYCDGGCSPNPGESGSGISIYKNGKLSELWYGLYEKNGTNNTAELGALYQSLLRAEQEFHVGSYVEIKCDSMYSINCIKTWGISWEKKNWTKKGGAIKNLDIIKKCYYLYHDIKKGVILSHVKAHAGEEGNELADRMTQYTRKQKQKGFILYEKEIDVSYILENY